MKKKVAYGKKKLTFQDFRIFWVHSKNDLTCSVFMILFFHSWATELISIIMHVLFMRFSHSCLCFFCVYACGTVYFSVSMPVLFNFFSSPAMLVIYFFSGPRICFLFIPYWILYSRNSMGILFFGPSQHNLVEAQSVDLVR